MPKIVYVARLPKCDWCGAVAEFDTPGGGNGLPWSNCCAACLPVYGRPTSQMTARLVASS